MTKDDVTWENILATTKEIDAVQEKKIELALKEMQSKEPKVMDEGVSRDFIIKRQKKSIQN